MSASSEKYRALGTFCSEEAALGVESLTPLQGEVSPNILDRPNRSKGRC